MSRLATDRWCIPGREVAGRPLSHPALSRGYARRKNRIFSGAAGVAGAVGCNEGTYRG